MSNTRLFGFFCASLFFGYEKRTIHRWIPKYRISISWFTLFRPPILIYSLFVSLNTKKKDFNKQNGLRFCILLVVNTDDALFRLDRLSSIFEKLVSKRIHCRRCFVLILLYCFYTYRNAKHVRNSTKCDQMYDIRVNFNKKEHTSPPSKNLQFGAHHEWWKVSSSHRRKFIQFKSKMRTIQQNIESSYSSAV